MSDSRSMPSVQELLRWTWLETPVAAPQDGFPARLSEAVCWKPEPEPDQSWTCWACGSRWVGVWRPCRKCGAGRTSGLDGCACQACVDRRAVPTPAPPPHHTGLADCRCLACTDRRAVRTPEPPPPAQNPLVALLNRYGNPHAYSQVRSIISPHELRAALQQYATQLRAEADRIDQTAEAFHWWELGRAHALRCVADEITGEQL